MPTFRDGPLSVVWPGGLSAAEIGRNVVIHLGANGTITLTNSYSPTSTTTTSWHAARLPVFPLAEST